MQTKLTIAVALAVLTAAPSGLAQVVAFENVNVIPMDRNRVLERQTVIIRDGRIARVGPASRVKAPEGSVRVDASGKFLMPGLAEMHGHLPPPNASRELVEHMLFLYVANGVTTVRGMQGNPAALERRAAVAAGTMLGPRLYVAGMPLGANAKTVEMAEKMVREQKASGYDLLKIMEGASPAVYDAIVKTAKEVGIDFAGHVPNDVGVRRAIAARQKSIDHLDNYLDALAAGNSFDEGKIAELARLTREAGVWNAPTMACWEAFHNGETGEALRDRMTEVRYMPRSTVEQWVKTKNGLLASGVFMGFGVGGQTGSRVIEVRRKMLKGLHDAGAGVILGTDSPQTFSVPGFSIHREMQVMAAAGFTPFEILQSGTRNVAVYFNTLAQAGTVEQGKRADLVLLEANPLKDTANVARRAGVVVSGRWIPESEIQQRLEQLAGAAPKM